MGYYMSSIILQPGYVFLTRNTEEVGNESPGFWNHCAIMSNKRTIVEAQELCKGVIEVKLMYFLERYPEFICLRHPNIKISIDAGRYASTIVSSPYRWDASRHWRLRDSGRGENCVSVVRRSYNKAFGKDNWWITPDDVLNHAKKHHWIMVYHKKDYENWYKPKEWFIGRIR